MGSKSIPYYFRIIDQFRVYLLAESTAPYASGFNGVFAPEMEAHWYFNGSGPVSPNGIWTKDPNAGDNGDHSFGPVVDSDIKTSGATSVEFTAAHNSWSWGT